jgi:hypothetical protein
MRGAVNCSHLSILHLYGKVILPSGALIVNVFRAYERSKALIVDNFDDGNTINTNSLGQPNTMEVACVVEVLRFANCMKAVGRKLNPS